MKSTDKRYIFEEMPVLKAILKLAIPSVLGQLILVIYNLADTFFIGLAANRSFYVDMGATNALIGGVTICMPVFMIISAISNLFGIGAASVMSRSMGKRNYDRARKASSFSFYGCLFSLIIYCLLILVLINPITGFLAGDDALVEQYSRIYILVTVVMCGIPTGINTLLSHLIRAEGDSFNASFGIALGGILNVALDPLFIFVIFDIKDAALAAALATGISNVIAMIYFFIYLSRKEKTFISLRFNKESFKENVPGEVLTIGLPACLMTLCENISYMVLDNCIAKVAVDPIVNQAALAGVGASKKINMFAHSIARGMTQGVLPLIGYNKSSGKRRRMRKIVFTSMSITTCIAILCLGINLAFAKPLCSIFFKEGQALDLAKTYLIVFSIGAPFSAIAYSVISFFQAVGKAWRSLLLALLRKGILDIPLMFILPRLIKYEVGIGVIWATPVADILCCITAIILFVVYLKNHSRHDKQVTYYDNAENQL